MILQKWKQCGVTAQGKDHIAAGVVCQDSVADAAGKGVHAVALSDGGGSRRCSEIGSAAASRAACRMLVERFDDYYARLSRALPEGADGAERLLELKLEMLDAVLDALRAELTPERTLYDFGCTLLFAAVKGGRYLIGHVGDGVIAGLYQEGLSRTVRVLSHPENGGAPNVTFFVTDHDARAHLRLSCGECPGLEGILLMSDGPEEVLYSAAEGMHPNAVKLFDNFTGIRRDDYAAALGKFLTGSIAGHSFDDLSLNVLYLESIEKERVAQSYAEELFAGVTARNQVRRMSAYAVLLDPDLPAEGGEADLSSLRCVYGG